MLKPDEIKHRLADLIQDAKPVFPKLASRLDEMRRWIAKKKSGLLTQKVHVLYLLAELVEDATFWLEVQSLSKDDRELVFAELSPPERYWYEYLFPAWFNEEDPKLNVWKQNLMSGNFQGSDSSYIENICSCIKAEGGFTLNPYVADLSMATDFIASGFRDIVLCVQLTTVRNSFSEEKRRNWEFTLQHWGIKRGLFASFNPGKEQVYVDIGKCVLRNSDDLPDQCYVIWEESIY